LAVAAEAKAETTKIGVRSAEPLAGGITKDQCVDANGLGQELRRVGKLTLAREQLSACASPACPAIVREDCTLRLDELETAQPTIAFSVKDASGADLLNVSVSVDGTPLAEQLDGSALPVDIGEHAFRFEIHGRGSILRTLVVTAAEKLRRVDIRLTTSRAAASPEETFAPPTTAAPHTEASPGNRALGTQQIMGVVAGGVGVVLLAGGGGFGLAASSRWSTAKGQCATHEQCSPEAIHNRNVAAEYATISNVGFIAGGVLAALGVTLFLTAPRARHARVALAVEPTGVRIAGSF
jgi:hypothetical protein